MNRKNVGLGLIGFFLVIQLIRIDKSAPAGNLSDDFIVSEATEENVAMLIKNACYDCHSHQTEYPWYAEVAPVSWWIKNHINEGRKHLNFSVWTTYNAKKQKHKLEECIEMMENNEMPLKSFTWTHPEAKLSDEQKALLVSYLKVKFNSL